MSDPPVRIRLRLDLRGQVQGVGFRPFAYRLAAGLGLAGSVANNSSGAVIEVEGPEDVIARFRHDLVGQLPPLARIAEVKQTPLTPLDEQAFRIRSSEDDGRQRPEVTPDAATCAACLRELFDPGDRRFRYPFINCTNCGPRYSIIRSVPYDRPQTTMSVFAMCPSCAREYHDPRDRRFHAQPNACPVCGPRLRLLRVIRPPLVRRDSARSRTLPEVAEVTDDPVSAAAAILRNGGIVAVKGIGGYHLACRADNENTVRNLRRRKLRDGKPLALMVPDLESAGRICRLTPTDLDALQSTAAPIVLARRREDHALAPSVAPGCADFGLMLPYTPLHHLLMAEGVGPLVMTSANLAGQPLTYRDEDALASLADVADAFLAHDREIFRPIDDSVVITFRDEVVPIRRARGYAPRPIRLAAFDADAGPLANVRARRILAVGGELKSTVCLLAEGQAVVSEHLGDLSHPDAYRHFVGAIDRLTELCGFQPDAVACDLHPRYLSSEYARQLDLPHYEVQHHHAHIASVMAEWGQIEPVIGLACDGTGYGPDGAVWGCEILLCHRGDYERLGNLDYFPLVGGDLAALETWRPAAALLRQAGVKPWQAVVKRAAAACGDGPGAEQLKLFERQADGGLNAPETSSLGRVFDAVSFMLGLCSRNRHEAEAAMALEGAAAGQPLAVAPLAYAVTQRAGVIGISLCPAVVEVGERLAAGERVCSLAARFHETVARCLADAAGLARRGRAGLPVVVSGGCFANRRLLARVVDLLEADGHRVIYPRRVPAGDGGLALGQALVTAWRLSGADPDS